MGAGTTMRDIDDAQLREGWQAIVDEAAPGSTLVAVRPMNKDGTHHAYVMETRSASGLETQLAVKLYRDDVGPARTRARLEFHALQLLQKEAVPVPQPFFLDADGALLGAPAMVTEFVHGVQMLASPD